MVSQELVSATESAPDELTVKELLLVLQASHIPRGDLNEKEALVQVIKDGPIYFRCWAKNIQSMQQAEIVLTNIFSLTVGASPIRLVRFVTFASQPFVSGQKPVNVPKMNRRCFGSNPGWTADGRRAPRG